MKKYLAPWYRMHNSQSDMNHILIFSFINQNWNINSLRTNHTQCTNSSMTNVTIGWGVGLSPVQHQAIIWSNAELLSTGPVKMNFSENWNTIQKFISTKCIWKYRHQNHDHFRSQCVIDVVIGWSTQGHTEVQQTLDISRSNIQRYWR